MNFTFNGTGTGATVGIDCFTPLIYQLAGLLNSDGGYGFICKKSQKLFNRRNEPCYITKRERKLKQISTV